jgi:hypothetical protein
MNLKTDGEAVIAKEKPLLWQRLRKSQPAPGEPTISDGQFSARRLKNFFDLVDIHFRYLIIPGLDAVERELTTLQKRLESCRNATGQFLGRRAYAGLLATAASKSATFFKSLSNALTIATLKRPTYSESKHLFFAPIKGQDQVEFRKVAGEILSRVSPQPIEHTLTLRGRDWQSIKRREIAHCRLLSRRFQAVVKIVIGGVFDWHFEIGVALVNSLIKVLNSNGVSNSSLLTFLKANQRITNSVQPKRFNQSLGDWLTRTNAKKVPQSAGRNDQYTVGYLEQMLMSMIWLMGWVIKPKGIDRVQLISLTRNFTSPKNLLGRRRLTPYELLPSKASKIVVAGLKDERIPDDSINAALALAERYVQTELTLAVDKRYRSWTLNHESFRKLWRTAADPHELVEDPIA